VPHDRPPQTLGCAVPTQLLGILLVAKIPIERASALAEYAH
jgi:hypothetical protein